MSNRKIVILEMLNKADGPISASDMARQFNVSRQSIVGDIALLRASGTDITATSRGYVLTEKMFEDHIYVGTLVCDHGDDRLEEELYTIVDMGGSGNGCKHRACHIRGTYGQVGIIIQI